MFIVVFMIGSVVGSFLNLCAERWSYGGSCCRPRSACANCHQTIRWYDLIPIVNQLWLQQRCRFCQHRLAMDWPLEAAAGLLASSGLLLPVTWRPYWWVLSSLYYLLAVMDLRKHAILLGPFLIGGSLCVLIQCGYYHQPLHLLAALLTGGIFYSFARFTHGFGVGDCDLLVLQSGLFGWEMGLQMLAFACILCLLTYCPLRRHFTRRLPFIPYLAITALILLHYHFTML